MCKYYNGPHMSINCQMEDPFAHVQPPQLPQEETLSIVEIANTHAHYMANAHTKFMDVISHAPQGENLSIAKMACAYTQSMDNKLLLEEQQENFINTIEVNPGE